MPALPDSPEWLRLLNVEPRRSADVSRADIPTSPGVYLWRDHAGDLAYVGKASNLRTRLSSHRGRGAALGGSSLRRNVCAMLFGIASNITGRPLRQPVGPEQAAAIAAWLDECTLSWVETSTVADAAELEDALRAHWLPSLNRI